LYTRLKIVSAGKACKKLPAYGRKKACNPAGLRPVIKTVIFLQGCRARLLGKAAEQGCRARLPGKAAWQGCNMHRYRGRSPYCSGRSPYCSGRIPNCSGRIPNCSGRIPNCSGRIPNCSGRIPNCSGRIPNCNGRIPNCMHARSLINVSAPRPTTKQCLDPRCTYIHAGKNFGSVLDPILNHKNYLSGRIRTYNIN
jgi:hypothetical protein